MKGNLESASAALKPPPLVHDLRSRSARRLKQMCGGSGMRGFGRYVRTHIAHVVARERTLPEKAITIAYLCCFLTDHLVQAEKRASELVDKRMLTPDEVRAVWERNYAHAVARVLQELPEGAAIRPVLDRLGNYSSLPVRAHHFRTRHWSALEHWLKDHHGTARQAIRGHLERVVTSVRSPHAKARAIILGGSLLADVECFTTHTEWPRAYARAMTDLYPVLFDHGEILAELL